MKLSYAKAFITVQLSTAFVNSSRFTSICRLYGYGPESIAPPESVNLLNDSLVRQNARGGEIIMGASAKSQDSSSEINDLEYDLDPNYIPSETEPFMDERQLRYFEKQLVDWRNSILAESQGTLNQLQDAPIREPDLNDRASSETDWGIELRTRDRQRKLIAKIDAALRRIKEGEYGYCQVTGEPISLARLRARPIATMTLEAQERHERQERVSRDD